MMPKIKKIHSGFTLIELLVVISIIAVLAIMGFAAFRGFTGRGNDGKRTADIRAIANVLETNKTPTGYQLIKASHFVANALPGSKIVPPPAAAGLLAATDPGGYPYCVATSGTVAGLPSDPTSSSFRILNGDVADWYGCPTGMIPVIIQQATSDGIWPPINTIAWKACSRQEGSTSAYCMINRQ